MTDWRVGHGFDIHRFQQGAPGDYRQMLCGIEVPVDQPLEAHSDGDVVLHAVTDAVLGAAGQGDLGDHFPDTDPRWAGASGDRLLAHALRLAAGVGYQLVNIDLTVVAQVPRLSPWKPVMRERLAGLTGLEPADVNIKATTMERLGPIGRKEGMAAHAVVLLRSL